MAVDTEHRPLEASEVLRAGEVAALLRVPVSTVHAWARAGQIPSRKRGRHRLFIRAEVERWLLDED